AKDSRIFDCDSHLVCYLAKELDLILVEGVFVAPCHRQDPKKAFTTDQRQVTKGVHSFGFGLLIHLAGNSGGIQPLVTDRLADWESVAGQRTFDGYQSALDEDALAIRVIQRVDAQPLAFLVRQHYRRRVTTHDLSHTG